LSPSPAFHTQIIFVILCLKVLHGMDLIPLKIDKLISTETGTGAFLMMLKEQNKPQDQARILPIVIGPFEAQAIIFGIEKQLKRPRPLTHDLFHNVLKALGYKLSRIIINKFSEGIFYARLFLEKDGQIFEFDSRPSDAVALAVRFEAPIYTVEEVMEKTGVKPEKMENIEPDFELEEIEEDEEEDAIEDDWKAEDIGKEIDRLFQQLKDKMDDESGQFFQFNIDDEAAKELADSFFKLLDSLLSNIPSEQRKKRPPSEEELRRMMNEAIANEDYERAAKLRDAINMLQKMKQKGMDNQSGDSADE